MAQSSKGNRHRASTYLELLTREGNPNEQAAALKALLREDPQRTFIGEAIAYVRDPDSVVSGRSTRNAFENTDRSVLLNKIEHLQWQLDFREKHDRTQVTPRLEQLGKDLRYHVHALAEARTKIRSYEADIAALRGEPTDADALLARLAATELENTRLKSNRSRKDQQVREWRREVEFLHEYIALLKKDPMVPTPDREWPPPSWRPTEEADPDVATVKELRAENERLQAENTYLKMERHALTARIDALEAKNNELLSVNIELEQRIEMNANETEAGTEMVWVVKFNNEREPDDYQVYADYEAAKTYYSEHEDSYPGGASLQAEAATNFDFRYCRIVEGEMLRGRTGNAPPKRIHAEPTKPEPIRPGPPKVSPVAGEPTTGRGRHFGAYPDPDTMQRIRGLSTRLRFDNTALLRFMIENEYANPPDKLPPRRKRANRVHHFGAYPDAATWAKIQELLDRYRIDNTELVSYLAEKNQ